MAAPSISIDDITTTAGRLLGTVVFWKIPKPAWRHDIGRAALDEYGIPLEQLVPEPPDDEEVFCRSTSAARDGGKHDVTRVCDDDDTVAFSVALKRPDAATRRTGYEHRAVAELDKATGAAKADGPEAEKVIAAYHADRAKLGSPEWSTYALAVMTHLGAKTLREKGGFYWVPSADGKPSEMVRALDRVFRAFGGRLGLLNIRDTDEDRRTLAEEAEDGFLADLLTLKRDIDGFTAKTRLTTMEDRLTQLAELRTRAGFVAAVLRTSADNFETELAGQEQRIRRALLGELDAPAAEAA